MDENKALIKHYNEKNLMTIIILFIISFGLRFVFISKYLDEWDSVQFVLGMHDFNIALHQPHPPGYPAYILLGKLFYYLLGNDVFALTFMSVLFGSISIIFTYLLGKEFFGERVGILSAIIMSFTPAHFLFSVVAMTDIVFLSFLTMAVYFMYIGLKKDGYLYLGSLLAGFSIGIRPQNFVLVIMLFIIIIAYKKEYIKSVVSIVISGVGSLIWFIPAAALSGGVQQYLSLTRSQVSAHDRWNFTMDQFNKFIDLILNGWTDIIIVFFVLSIIALSLILKEKKVATKTIFNNKPLMIISIWLSISVITCIALYTLYITRYTLPSYVPIALIAAYSIIFIYEKINKTNIKIIFGIFVSFIIIFMAINSIMLVSTLANTPPAPVQAAAYIEKNYDQENTIIVVKESIRQFQYYLPNFESVLSISSINFSNNKSVIISDKPLSLYENKKIKEFNRSYDVYPKHHKVVIYETEVYDNILINSGFYDEEHWGGITSRWAINNSIVYYISSTTSNGSLSFNILSFNESKNLFVYLNGDLVHEEKVPTKFINISIPVNFLEGMNEIRLYSDGENKRPADIKELNNNDSRPLAFAIHNMSINFDIFY